MKKISIFFVIIALLIGTIQSQNMCSSTLSTSTTGTIYDSGGPGGNYGNNENCGFLINPGCATSITLSFVFINIESCCDDINVYDGVDNTGTLLLNAQGTTTPSPVIANSGTMYIEFISDGSVTPAGFEANWTSTIGSQSAVTANFNISNATPDYLESVDFTDVSTSSPVSWLWDFGGGSTSTDQNPSHAFNTPGSNNVRLIASNCTFSDTIDQVITVQQPPSISVSPDPLIVNLDCGDSLVQNITIENTGTGTLNITGGSIGGGGVNDSSYTVYTVDGALTNHSFPIVGNIDTLHLVVYVNGDYDAGSETAEVFIEGVSFGIVGGIGTTNGLTDSLVLAISGSQLATILADGQVDVSIQNTTGVNTTQGGTNSHLVHVYTFGEGWLSGTVPVTSLSTGSSIQVPVTFYSFGLYQGTYNSTITIESNDPGNPYQLPVTMNIAGSAVYSLSDTCIDYGSILQNATKSDTIEITNSGCDTLFLSSVSTTNADFNVTYSPSSLLPGISDFIIVDFNPNSIGSINGNLLLTTNVEDTSICLSGTGLVAPILTVTPDPLIVNLDCGDSLIQNITIENTGGSTLNITGGTIGGGGVSDSSTLFYNSTGATTTHNFTINGALTDTLFLTLTVNGDFDLTSEFADIYVDGVLIANFNPTQNNTDVSITIPIVDPDLSNFLADGQISVDIVNSSSVNTGFGTMMHMVEIFTNGEGWLAGTVPTTSLAPGNTVQVPVTFYSFGLFQGSYTSSISIESNDPGSPYILPVTMNISGTAIYSLSDTCIDFGSILQNATELDTIEVTNSGCDTLFINSATTTNSDFNVVSSVSSLLPGASGVIIIDFTPSSVGNINGNLVLVTNVEDTSICLSGIGLVAPVLTATPNPFIVNLDCGDSIIQNFTIENTGGSTLNIIGGLIGGVGVNDSSYVVYTVDGALTNHSFPITGNVDTLFMVVYVNGDYDAGSETAEVFIEGVSYGIAGGIGTTNGLTDSLVIAITGSQLATFLADGQIDVSVQNTTGVNTTQGGTNSHLVHVYTFGESWLSGTISTASLSAGNTVQVPVSFYSFGLFQGTYNSIISIESNDPGSPYELPVVLNISGTSQIGMSATCLNYGSSVVGLTLTDTLEIYNSGCDTLSLSNLIPSNSDYVVTNISANDLLPGMTSYVVVDFTPVSTGSSNGTLLIQSNLSDTTICLTGAGSNIVSNFTVSGQNPCSAQFQFTETSVGTPTSWTWDFGDGNTSTAENPIHLYSSVGSYLVSLIVCNSSGCDTSEMVVTSNFILDYSIAISGIMTPGSSISFEAMGDDIVSSTWDFGDGSTLPGTIVNHSYADTGTYIVSTAIITIDPCAFTIYDTVHITNIKGLKYLHNTDLNIFPNPSSGEFNLSLNGYHEDVNISIYNAIGELVYLGKNVILDNYKIQLKEQAGIYLVKVSKDSQPIFEKPIIINK